MGAVYEAEQRMGTTLRKVAVKVLLPEWSRDATLRRRFDKECAIIAQLEHPHTVDVYDFGETETGQLYVVMEFVRGQSLGSMPQPLTPHRTVRILGQVCGALQEAHRLGIVHRDLKPDNVLLTRRAGEDFAKLLDFGIALHTGGGNAAKTRLTAAGTVLGTPPYMSPEQLEGATLDARSDVYSLGVIAYELLTGRLPFAARTPWEWAQRHRFDAPAPFDFTEAGRGVPEALRAVVCSALAKRPEQRPRSAGEFARRLEVALAGVPATRPRERSAIEPQHDLQRWDRAEPTEAALVAPVLHPARRRSLQAWIGVALAAPLVALGLSAMAVTGAWVATLDEPQRETQVAATTPPLVELQPDAVSSLGTPVASASATFVAPPASEAPESVSLPPPTVASPTTRPPRATSTAASTGRRPPRPRR
jgi:serine/threonine protein kinase